MSETTQLKNIAYVAETRTSKDYVDGCEATKRAYALRCFFNRTHARMD